MELVIATITFAAMYFTGKPIVQKQVKWYWVVAPMVLGATLLAWAAYIVV